MSRDKESLERHEDSLKKIGPQICCIPNGSWGLAKCKSAAKNMLVLTQIWASLFLDQLLQNRTLIALSNKKLEACSPFRSSATTQQTQSIVHNQQLNTGSPGLHHEKQMQDRDVTAQIWGITYTQIWTNIDFSFNIWFYRCITFADRRLRSAVCGLQSTNNITACLAARRSQISHRVWKNIPCVSAASEWNIFEHEKRNFVSLSGHVKMFYLCINQWNTKPFHLNVPISYIKYAPCNIWLDFSFVLQLPAWRLFAR